VTTQRSEWLGAIPLGSVEAAELGTARNMPSTAGSRSKGGETNFSSAKAKLMGGQNRFQLSDLAAGEGAGDAVALFL